MASTSYSMTGMEYDDNSGIGNISSITGTGSGFSYGNNAGPHALTSLSQPEPLEAGSSARRLFENPEAEPGAEFKKAHRWEWF